MKIIASILVALMAIIGGTAALYGLFLGVTKIFDVWIDRKERK